MAESSMGVETAMSVVQNCLVVTLQGEPTDQKYEEIRRDVLNKIQATSVRGMIVDLGSVRMLDRRAFNSLADTSRMAALLGIPTVFVALQPGVVSALIDLEVDTSGLRTALTLEAGFEQLQSLARASAESEPGPEPGPEADVKGDSEDLVETERERGEED